MKMKNQILRLIAFTLLAMTLIVFIVNIVIDPFIEHPHLNILHLKKFGQDFQSSPYQFYEKLSNNKYSLVFGTSHSANLTSESLGEPILNMSLSTYGNPSDIYSWLNGLNQQQWDNIHVIYLLVDYHTLVDKTSPYDEMNFHSRRDFYRSTIQNLNRHKLLKSVETVVKNVTGNYNTSITDQGEYLYERPIAFHEIKYSERVKFHTQEKAIQKIKLIQSLATKNSKPVILFKTTFSSLFLINLDWPSVQNHYRTLAQSVGPLVNLMYRPEYSTNIDMFRDATHHVTQLTDASGEILMDENRSQQFIVNKNNVEEYLIWLKRELDEFL